MNTDMAPGQTQRPALNQIDLIVDDMDASIGFYRLLGLDIPDAPTWPPASGARHTGTMTAGGASLELDNVAMARIWDAGFRGGVATRVVIGLALATADAVDQTYARATEAGHRGGQAPIDQARRYVPSAAS